MRGEGRGEGKKPLPSQHDLRGLLEGRETRGEEGSGGKRVIITQFQRVVGGEERGGRGRGWKECVKRGGE